ncbi:BA14K family protein [Microvirga puerhi]|uniref:Lectin-like protein BA14k n=1 Tax=Microvirga puerhi TaxID=2876078 RepID=A0ABS7VPV2_9HYPH|nr:BA14K family protein [Microvirga puerhi]MBZ6077593.1 BA14K family protein [Microvirga puerhi]
MKTVYMFVLACSISAGAIFPAFAQGENLDCNLPEDAMTAYCNHRDLYGKNGPGMGAVNPYGIDPGATGSVMATPGQAAPMADQSRVAACSARYRTYDPASNTFMGRDGRRHTCQ